MKANEYKYKEKNSRQKEQFITGIKIDEMTTEIIQELIAVKKTSEITSEQVLDGPEGWKCSKHKSDHGNNKAIKSSYHESV